MTGCLIAAFVAITALMNDRSDINALVLDHLLILITISNSFDLSDGLSHSGICGHHSVNE